MGRKVGEKNYFKKKFCPIFYFMTHLFPTAQLNKNVNDVALIRHLATSNIANFMWYIFYWSKNKNLMPREGTKNKKIRVRKI